MKRLFLILLLLPVFTKAQIITTIAGNGTGGFSSDGVPATVTELSSPYGVGTDSMGNLFIGDAGNNRIRKIDTAGIITTVAGTGVAGYNGDLILATTAQLNFPYGMAVSKAGIIVIADMSNHRIRSIKFESGGLITTIAGTGVAGFSGDSGLAINAQLNNPQGIFWDVHNNVYFGDHYNHRIRKIDGSGIITTIAGNGTPGFGGDGGPATAAELYYPSGVTMDSLGNIYIADMYNQRIRKIDIAGIITTVAGTGTAGYSGDGGLATLADIRYPKDVYIDRNGNIIITDPDNERLRMINSAGIITTIAGNGVQSYCCDGGLATLAELNEPQGVFVDKDNNIYTGDCLNNRIRKIICAAPVVAPITGPDTVCIDSIATFSSTTAGGSWTSANSNANITTAGVVTAMAAGLDTIKYSVSNSCGSVEVSFPIYLKSCSTSHVTTNNWMPLHELKIYPDPANTEITITGPMVSSISITNLIGQTIYTNHYNSEKVQIDISSLPTGVYFIKVNGTEVRKFIKQ